jgi:hypothetical protein
MMRFDELHDPDPPEPGMREFALVAERAQGIRQRRAAWVVRIASVVVVAGAAVAIYQVSARSGTTPSAPPVTTELTPTPSTPSTPSSRSPMPSTAPTLNLAEAQSASALPPIALGPGLLTISDEPLVEIFEATDGSTCTQADVTVHTPSCAPAGAGFIAIEYGEGDATRLAIVVDPTVDVSFDAADAECTQGFPDFAVEQVWVCAGLDADTTTVEFQTADRVVVHS